MFKTWLVTFVALFLTSSALTQAPLTQIVSRENAGFDCRGPVMTVGRDGRVYLSNQSPGFVLRFGRDGSDKGLVDLMWRWHSVTPHVVAALRGGHNMSRHGVSGPH